MRAFIPPMRPVPPGASDTVRRAMHRQAMAELVKYNPHSFLAPGTRRRWWHRLIGKMEYPKVLLPNAQSRVG